MTVCIDLRQVLVFICPGVAALCPCRSRIFYFCLFSVDISVKLQRYAVRSCVVFIVVIDPCLCAGDFRLRTYLNDRLRVFVGIAFILVSILQYGPVIII